MEAEVNKRQRSREGFSRDVSIEKSKHKRSSCPILRSISLTHQERTIVFEKSMNDSTIDFPIR